MYGEGILHFYKNFKVLEDGTKSSGVKGVDLVHDAKPFEGILNVSMERFDTYVRREWTELEEKEDDMYFTSK